MEGLFLKRLELQGFKSFADKVQLHFKPGITIVVGPNGSGKSNIADAIRWVLGEQSAKSLRGSKMEDIIFSGSDKRRPLGMAEVSITIDNTSGLFPLDFNEVTVTRRLYRSGESDFLINNVQCRLKDIHEMFMDTGIGREGFSIIGQGKVDEILNAKPEERRLLIEEAAGIVKYRYRKKDATKKLEDTEQNLLRVKDIILELSDQVEPLQIQSQKAEQFMVYKNNLERIEISLIVQESIDINNRLENGKNELVLQTNLHTEAAAKLHNLEATIENDKLEHSKIEEALSDLQDIYYNKNTDLEKAENDIKILQERINNYSQHEDRLASEIKAETNQLAQLTIECNDVYKKNITLKKEFALQQSLLLESEKKLSEKKQRVINIENKLEESKTEIIEQMNKQANLRNQLAVLDQQKLSLENQRIQKIQAQHQHLENKQSYASQKNKCQEKLSELTSEASFLKDKQASCLANLESLQNKEINILNELQSFKEHFSRYQSKKNVLEEMEENYHGYFQGVKEILLAKDKINGFQGVCGTVAHLINAPSKLEMAIETALGGALQNIVTDNETTAQGCIAFLKQHKKGRATFLPLTTIKSNLDTLSLEGEGVLGRAVDLVVFDAMFKPVMDYLLGKIWIVEKLDQAVALSKKTGFKYRIVTLDGDLITPGGALTGGHQKNSQSSLLNRKREISEINKLLEEYEVNIKRINDSHLLIIDEKEEFQRNIENIKNHLGKLEFEKMEHQKDVEQFTRDVLRVDKELEIISYQLEEINEEQTQLQAKKNTLTFELNELELEKNRLEIGVKGDQEWLAQQKGVEADENTSVTNLKIQVATFKQNLETIEDKISYLELGIRNVQSSIDTKQNEIIALTNHKEDANNKKHSFEVLIKDFVLQLNKTEVEIQKYKDNKAKLILEIAEAEKTAKELSKRVNEYQSNIHNLEIRIARLEMEFSNYIDKLSEVYGLTFAQGRDRIVPIESKKAAQQEISKLKEQIELLGPINIAAIEEYKRVTERLDFLSKQVLDLEQAKESLYRVINEMNRIMVKKFKETFVIVNQGFEGIFKELFGGGKAELILTEPENILETGLEIMAQPPGKKTQFLSLLSGGERALTAICLLLAILKCRPSPFCVLDEIEAALDEANVARFAQYLKAYIDRTQFICVSHRKGTMEVADVLYGVTIEETGVSKMVAVELSEVLEKVG